MTKPYHQEIAINEATTPATAVEGEIPDGMKASSGKELLKEVLAVLRAQSWLLQTLHWRVHGKDFYELHLLFERLYGNLGGEIDALAEKLVGYYGEDAVEESDAMKRAHTWLNTWEGEPIDKALQAEKQLQALLRKTYDTMDKKSELSLGLDDYLMATANAHETHLYLLGQIKD
jgi:DNA-binding ferritin-like protein